MRIPFFLFKGRPIKKVMGGGGGGGLGNIQLAEFVFSTIAW